MYVTVASFPDPIEAMIVCGRLQAEGIDAHVADAQMTLANWEWRQAVGGTKVRVLREQLVHARNLVAAFDNGEFMLEAEDQSADPALSPDRESFSSRLAYVFGFLFGIPLPWRRHPYDTTRRSL